MDAGWRRVDLLDQVGSTNAVAAQEPAPWHLVAAHDQSAGRGRLGRSWVVPAGASATLSMTVPLPASPTAWGWVPLLVGDAVRGALHELGQQAAASVQVGTKWPNDVLVRAENGLRAESDESAESAEADGSAESWRKVAGVLCQVVQPTSGPALVVVGVGVNVSQVEEELPVDTATSLHILGAEASRDDVLAAVAGRVRRLALDWDHAAFGDLQERMRHSCLTLGAEVEVHTPDGGVLRRRAVAIDDGGRLVTVAPGEHADSGPRMVFSVADIVHARLRRTQRS